jgi:hypothetical protein
MGWFDRFRRSKESTADDTYETPETEDEVAGELEEEAHEARDEQALEEPRPPGG